MASPTRFRLTGDREMLKKLERMRSPSQIKVIARRALDAGGGVIKRAIADNAMKIKDTGLLAKSVKVRHAKPKIPNSILAVVGPTHMKRMMRRTKKGVLRAVSKGKVADWRAKGEKLIPYDPGNYAHLVERGTKAHIIRPKNKKAMSFGGEHPVKIEVGHPGTQGIGFMRRAVASHGRIAENKVTRKLWDEIRKIAARRGK